MKTGILMFATDYAIRPDELAREAEVRGFESIWLPEHTHIPASRKSPWPGGKELPREYWHTHDLFVALAMAAAVTSRIRLGTGICLVVERDPITLAKEVATLDFLSEGRVLFGVGGGWNVEEMENHGTDFGTRWKLMRERIEAMKAIWADEEAEYHGDLVRFEKLWSYPKPKQKPHPPIHVGGAAPHALRRVVRYGDGWMPIVGREEILPHVATLRRMAEEAGRNPDEISVSLFGMLPDERKIEEAARAGVERIVLPLPAADRDTVLPLLDQYAKVL